MEHMVAPPYGKKVLIGNWVDRRYSFDEKSSGILPGLSPSDQCERHRSLSQDTYTNEPYKTPASKREFVEKRATRVRNIHAATTSNVKLMDAAELRNNYTTTNTLVYDWLPRLRQELAARKSVPARGIPAPQTDTDLLQCFGNLTKTHNFAKQFECVKILDELKRMQTTYGSAYNRCRNSEPV